MTTASSASVAVDGRVLLHPRPVASADVLSAGAPSAADAASPTRDEPLDLGAVADALGRVALSTDASFTGTGSGLDAAALSQVLSVIDRAHSALSALEMRTMTALDTAVRGQDIAEGAPARDQGRRTADEVRMASRISPALASRRLRAGERLVREMPRMFEALATGAITSESAYAIGRAAGPIQPDLRSEVDEVLDQHLPDLEGASTSRWSREVDALAQTLDPQGAPRRRRRAEQERSVTVRAGAHGMGTVTAHLSGLDCRAIRRRLSLEAEKMRAAGDDRTHGQLMADLLSDTILGRHGAVDPVTLQIGVVISERALFSPAHGEPAMIEGYGVIDAGQVRDHVLGQDIDTRRERAHHSLLGEPPQAEPEQPTLDEDLPLPDAIADLTDLTDLEAPAQRRTQQVDAITAHLRAARGAPPAEDLRAQGPPGSSSSTTSPSNDRPSPSDAPHPDAGRSGTDAVGLSPGERYRRALQVLEAEEGMADELRRLYTHPSTGELVAMESRSRAFPQGLARYMRIREILCVGPYCDTSIRHADHIRPHAEGGLTSALNGQALCAHCNLTKETLGSAEHVPAEDGSHRVTWTSRLGATATVTPGSQTGLPMSRTAAQAHALDADPRPWFDRASADGHTRGKGRSHLRLLIEEPELEPVEGLIACDPCAGRSASDEDRMHQAAMDAFAPAFSGCDADWDEQDILHELDRLDALGRPDDDLGSLRSSA
ncbi:HNH endonuclease [Brachybacterium halotolerans subsp. kimchii]|uniref:HNH endonuclease n=1 Tax=Brachybacterium halotolerans TaxID=2795215 RepID=UPI001E2EC23C|nr:HNH endonuclease signature motif containing protein [Brachybacterium halotolerans]UEJ82349.1 HNH endonuclease [Brachybacterium halotolerans subsp. kimchii]